MKTRHEEIPFSPSHPLIEKLCTEDSIFFDIETTGFSPKHTSLYLIGCARRKGSLLCLDQFFAESKEEEPLILKAFLELIRPFHTIITYNGIGFDIPYLKAKCSQHGLIEVFSDFAYVDIFKSVSKLKHILKLENYKQKSIEAFLKLSRNDRFSGGELIPVYQTYCKAKDEELLSLLLLHNYEDVLGMMDLIPVLSYLHLFEGNFREIRDIQLESTKTFEGMAAKELLLTVAPDHPLPRQISFGLDDIYLSGNQEKVSLAIRLYEGELKYFYPNYKDYYYLPAEDTSIHKSVAAYVDKAHREQAKASTCYTKKNGLFLPQYNTSLFAPAFFRNYGDKTSYFTYSDSFLNDEAKSAEYARHLLRFLLNGKSCL